MRALHGMEFRFPVCGYRVDLAALVSGAVAAGCVSELLFVFFVHIVCGSDRRLSVGAAERRIPAQRNDAVYCIAGGMRAGTYLAGRGISGCNGRVERHIILGKDPVPSIRKDRIFYILPTNWIGSVIFSARP